MKIYKPRELEEYISISEECNVCSINKDNTNVVMTSYDVFPGIKFVFHYIHTETCDGYYKYSELNHRLLEIHHCREGRIECECNDEFYYQTAGDLSIVYKKDLQYTSFFPLKHYHGVSIIINLDQAPDCCTCILEDVNVRPLKLAEKFCKDKVCYIARANSEIEHIFTEIYTVPEKIKRGYFKVKVLELLLFLSEIDICTHETDIHSISKTEVKLAKNVSAYIMKQINQKLTLEQLAIKFNVSSTKIKSSFKHVYGISTYSYIKMQKMQSAAMVLKETDSTILEIAGKFGYSNASKFTSAFKDVMGMTPKEYRVLE